MTHHAIHVESLSYRYPDGQLALDDVTLYVAPNERAALVGPNGSGKSTLLLHLIGILRGSAGKITVGGLTLTDTTAGQIRAMAGLVFQNPEDQLFSPRVYDDIAFAPLHMGLDETTVKQRVEQALGAVGMRSYAQRSSHRLSLGEQKRIAIASVLSMNPQILLLDEPTAGLDPRARRSLMALLLELEQQTMLISTHDMRFANELCTRTIILDNGRVAADGATAVILHDHLLMEQHGLETP